VARFSFECHMRWGDMDAYAHVNNTAYLTYLEQARIAMFFDRYDGTFARGTVISRHEIDYLKPVVYHADPLRIELWVGEIRAASFHVHYEVHDLGQVVARAQSTCVLFDFEADRPRRIQPNEREILIGYADEPDAPAAASDVRADAGPP
jgi:acyl-CoA thioester hydrolase